VKRVAIMQNQALAATTRDEDPSFEFILKRGHAPKKIPGEGFKRLWRQRSRDGIAATLG